MTTQTESKPKLEQFTMLERAVLYARVSGDDRGKEGRNLQSQLEMGREYATEKGYHIIAELAEDDRGASGAEIDLPRLNQIRESARGGEFEVLIVRELDRLSRNLAKQLIVEEELGRVGVRVEYVLAEYDDTPEGQLNKHIRASIAEYDRLKIIERLHRGKKLKVKGGSVVVAGRPPYGYRLVKEEKTSWLVIDDHEAYVVRLIFELYLDGLSIVNIKRKLNELGIPTPKSVRRNKIGWINSTIHSLLRNETYKGTWYYGKFNNRTKKMNPRDRWLAVDVPAIVPPEMWAAAQERLDIGKRDSKRNIKPNRYLLAKRVTCGFCGYRVTGQCTHSNRTEGVFYLYYVCPARRSADCSHDCTLPRFNARKVDDMVWNWVKSYFEDEERLEAGIKRYLERQEDAIAPLKDRLKVINDLIKKHNKELTEAHADLKDLKNRKANRTRARILNDMERIETTLDGLERQRAGVIAELEAATLSEKDIQAIRDYAAQVREGLEIADASFDERHWLFVRLDVRVRLTVENEDLIAYAECRLGDSPHRLVMNSVQYHKWE